MFFVISPPWLRERNIQVHTYILCIVYAYDICYYTIIYLIFFSFIFRLFLAALYVLLCCISSTFQRRPHIIILIPFDGRNVCCCCCCLFICFCYICNQNETETKQMCMYGIDIRMYFFIENRREEAFSAGTLANADKIYIFLFVFFAFFVVVVWTTMTIHKNSIIK